MRFGMLEVESLHGVFVKVYWCAMVCFGCSGQKETVVDAIFLSMSSVWMGEDNNNTEGTSSWAAALLLLFCCSLFFLLGVPWDREAQTLQGLSFC